MRDVALGELVKEVFRRGGFVRGVRRAEAVLRWPEVVGADVARFATAVALKEGVLIVEVADTETAMHLGLQRQHVLDAYRDRVGANVVRDVRFRVGRAPVSEEAPVAPNVAPDPSEVAALAHGLEGLPDALFGSAAAAGRALAGQRARRRAAGWRPCPICGTLAEPGASPPATPPAWFEGVGVDERAEGRTTLCHACARHIGAPKVIAASARLLVAPDGATPALTEDERRVARVLALARARRAIRELLPQTLADPAARGPLAQLVRCTVALRREVALADVDLGEVDPHRDGVDARAMRALGHVARGRPIRTEEI